MTRRERAAGGGRTYAIPFDQVWLAALFVVREEMRCWSVASADDEEGSIGIVRRRGRRRRPAEIQVRLDDDGQTRVDLVGVAEESTGPAAWLRIREIRRFLSRLDRATDAVPGLVLDPPHRRRDRTGGAIFRTRTGNLSRGSVLVAALVSVTACGEDRRDPLPAPSSSSSEALEFSADSLYRRALVFVGDSGDYVSPWLFRERTELNRVERSARAWLFTDSAVRLLDERWNTPLFKSVGRVLPGRALRITARFGGEIQSVIADADVPTELELFQAVAERSGGRAGLRILRARLHLADGGRVSGSALERSSVRAVEEPGLPPWAFLMTEDGTVVVVELAGSLVEGPNEEASATSRVWAVVRGVTAAWPSVEVRASSGEENDAESGSGESASDESFRALVGNRSPPRHWRLAAPDGSLMIDLRTMTAVPAGPGAPPSSGSVASPSPMVLHLQGSVLLGGSRSSARGVLVQGLD